MKRIINEKLIHDVTMSSLHQALSTQVNTLVGSVYGLACGVNLLDPNGKFCIVLLRGWLSAAALFVWLWDSLFI